MSNSNNQSTSRTLRKDRQNPYVMILREMLQDKFISPLAKGVLCYLLSLEDFQITESELMDSLNIKPDELSLAIKELGKSKYIIQKEGNPGVWEVVL
jgi:hypothetical protein